jgi:hypothetical protein
MANECTNAICTLPQFGAVTTGALYPLLRAQFGPPADSVCAFIRESSEKWNEEVLQDLIIPLYEKLYPSKTVSAPRTDATPTETQSSVSAVQAGTDAPATCHAKPIHVQLAERLIERTVATETVKSYNMASRISYGMPESTHLLVQNQLSNKLFDDDEELQQLLVRSSNELLQHLISNEAEESENQDAYMLPTGGTETRLRCAVVNDDDAADNAERNDDHVSPPQNVQQHAHSSQGKRTLKG